MFWGKVGQYFGGGKPFIPTCYMGNKFDTLLLSNMIVDMVDIEESLDIDNSIIKPEFGLSTALLADFKNNLEGGNFSNQGIQIQYLRFKRRKIGELKWQTMLDIEFDKNIENYDIMDYFVENATDYEFSLVPVTQSQEGNGVTGEIETEYFSLFLTGRDSNGILHNYPLRFDLSLSDITLNEDKVIQKTLSSKYPAFMNGESQYLSGSITADLISPVTIKQNGLVNMKVENAYREAFEEFIHSGKAMLIRNHSFYILGVLSEPKKNPIFNGEVGLGLWVFNMAFTEIDDAQDMQILKDNDITYEIKTE